MSDDLGEELDVVGVDAERLDRLVHHDLAAVDLDAVLLFERFGDVLGGDGAVESAVRARGGADLHAEGLELLGERLTDLAAAYDDDIHGSSSLCLFSIFHYIIYYFCVISFNFYIIHGFNLDYASKAEWKWISKNLNKAEHIIVLAQAFKDILINHGVTTDIQLSTTKVPDDMIEEFDVSGRTGEVKNILFLSRIEKSKGVFEAVQTYNMLKIKYRCFRIWC